MFVATVVREHSDIDNAATESEEAARACPVNALYRSRTVRCLRTRRLPP
jgi:hypothetical protein